MPTYEYLCEDCLKEFSVIMSMVAHGTTPVVCPKCASHKVVQQYSVFFAQTSKKS